MFSIGLKNRRLMCRRFTCHPVAAKLIFFAALASGLTLAAPADTQAQNVKIGYVDDAKVLQNYEAWTKAEEQFQTEVRAWDDEAQRMYQAYVDDSLDFERQRLILSADRKIERKAEIGAKRQATESFTKDIYGPNGQAERKKAGLTKPLVDNMNAAIVKVASDGNYDVIFNSSGLAYINPAFDITDKVIEILSQEG